MTNYEPHPDYHKLPEAVRVKLTEKEYAWLGDYDRSRLLEDETTPNLEGDDV